MRADVISADYENGLNLINKTDTLEIAAIMDKATAVIGMDGGLIHVAGFTDTQIVAGYTLVDPVHVAPIRYNAQSYKFKAIEPNILVPNRYFQTYKHFHKGDYRVFPGWERVIAEMKPESFISHLETIL